MYRTLWILCLMTFLWFLNEGSALICYSCSASIGHSAACENISDHWSEISHHECFYKDAVCATYKIKYGNDVIIYRSCKNADLCFGLSKKFNTQFNQLIDCQTCNDGDLCNSGHSSFSSSSFTKVSLVSIIVIYFVSM